MMPSHASNKKSIKTFFIGKVDNGVSAWIFIEQDLVLTAFVIFRQAPSNTDAVQLI